ncbi:MAG: alcohol dehydrogenase catalytic domain-containing protein [Deltaproteobacteria bacterium]|nr:alcohol dehydrogenase catalytic domain-containing protein [Deltaproteobacteria bacterium]
MTQEVMQALQYELSIPRYLVARGLTKLQPHRFHAWISPLHLRAVPIPDLPGPEWVRIRTEACGICGSDLNALRGAESFSMEPYASFPCVMGHEIIGRVVACGKQANGIAEGTRVAVENVLPCAPRGITPPCAACAAGNYSLCANFANGHLAPGVLIGFTKGLGGGWGEFCVAHKSQLFPVPGDIPTRDAVLIDSLASALQPVADHFPPDDATVLVYGAGIIGLNVIQCLRAAGSRARIIAIGRHAFQADWATRLGASEVITRNLFPTIADLTSATIRKPTLGPPVLDGGVDHVFDCVGTPQTIDYSMRFVRKRGTVVVVGTAGLLSKVDASPLWFKEVRLTGSAMFSHSTIGGIRKRTYQHVIDLMAGGKLRADGLVTHQFPIAEYAKALTTALDKKRHQGIKVAFEF